MARAQAEYKINWAQRQKEFDNETKPEMDKQLNKLIAKIGYVNVVALLGAINAMAVVDVSTPYSDKNYRNGWFALQGTQNDERGTYAAGVEVLVDDKLEWRERWVDIFGKMQFGMK